MPPYQRIEVESRGLARPLLFDTRPGYSDEKAITEVVARRAYARHKFTPRPGERWIDLGANVGAFSVWAAAHGADVIAFEPEPGCLAMAEHNVALNGLGRQVVVVPAAVVAGPPASPRMTLSVNGARGNVWRSSLHKSWRGGTDVEVDVVDVTPLWAEDACIKMDIEGAEMPILERLATRPVRRLVFEWSFDIDTSLARFRAVVAALESTYEHVRGVPHGRTDQGEHWQMLGPANAAMIYCWNEE